MIKEDFAENIRSIFKASSTEVSMKKTLDEELEIAAKQLFEVILSVGIENRNVISPKIVDDIAKKLLAELITLFPSIRIILSNPAAIETHHSNLDCEVVLGTYRLWLSKIENSVYICVADIKMY